MPGKSHGRRSLVGCSPWGCWGSDMTERLHFHFSFSCIGEGNGNPLPCSCLENPRDGGAWWAAVFGVAQSWTRLKWLSSSSSSRVSFLLGKLIGVEGLYGGCMFSFLRNLCPWFLTKMHGTVIWKYSKRNQSYLGNSDSGIGGTLKKGGSETWALLVHVVLNIRVIKALKNSYRNFIKFL